jgi:hypothetical protein
MAKLSQRLKKMRQMMPSLFASGDAGKAFSKVEKHLPALANELSCLSSVHHGNRRQFLKAL